MTAHAFEPVDAAPRRAVQYDLDSTLLVEAGAGTGKTYSLVSRVVELIVQGRARLTTIAAITFTEAAAAELRDRIREGLERRAATAESDDVRALCEQGVADLDQAAIQTLHGFAASLIMERPLEAGLPPTVEVLDEVRAGILFDERWEAWLDQALDDPALQQPLRLALSMGLKIKDLREAAKLFHDRYDLLRLADFPDEPFPAPEVTTALIDAERTLESLCAYAKNGNDDPLVQHVQDVCRIIRRLGEYEGDASRCWRLLANSPRIKVSRGRQSDWETDPLTGLNACKVIKDTLADLQEMRDAELAKVRRAALMPLLRAVRSFVLDYAEERKRRGQAEFHDLLVWARDLLRDNIQARDHFRARFTHILIDEFQDTDPIQAEIALFLAEDVPEGTPDARRPRRWQDVQPTPGKLFVVGDPKQSIYRFRHADITLVGQLRAMLGVEPLPLVQNFRSHRPVIEWVNHVFGQWMVEGEGQPAYTPLQWRWETSGAGRPGDPAVHCIGAPLPLDAAGVRRVEADAIAKLLPIIVDEGWMVRDDEVTAGEARYRPARYSDICVLVPRRTGVLRYLEPALEEMGVPYRLESASLVFGTQEVLDLLNCLEAVDNPVNRVALVAALRSPAFACSDEDLLAFVEAGGRLDYQAPGRNAPSGPVLEALDTLADYHRQSRWMPFSLLIERFVRERQLMELALGQPRPREQWRRYRFVIDRAAAFAEAGGTSLRAFLDWMRGQQAQEARTVETPVPEGDEDAVRIMTIHGSKGLEFPIVVMADLSGRPNDRVGPVLFERESGRVEVSFGDFQTGGYDDLRRVEVEREREQHIRLMYVAATRAKDHLVVSRFRPDRDRYECAASAFDGFLKEAAHLWRPIAPTQLRLRADGPSAQGAFPSDSAAAREQWVAERARLLSDRGRPLAVAATALAHEEREERATEGEPWRKGRAGTSLGRAVHAVLQTVDLATGAGLEETARAQAQAEGITGREEEVVALVHRALASECVGRAVRSGRWWREVPVGIPVGDGVLEGFIDLLFEEDGSLVVVDYKTDALRSEEEAVQAMQRYRLQGAAYALALEQATGRPVSEVRFLFLQPQLDLAVEGLRDAMAQVEQAAVAYLSAASSE